MKEIQTNMPGREVLIVDDDKAVQTLLTRHLKDAGYRCRTVSNVAEAKNILQTRSFDLLLTDINMPGESGIELTQYVKADYPDLPVIIVSIIDNPLAAQELLDLDVYGYIVKPFTRNLVLITVENAMIRVGMEQQSRAYQQQLESTIHEQTSAIKTSEEKYRQIIENIGIGVALISPQLEILQMNSQLLSWFPDVKPGSGSRCFRSFRSSPRNLPCDNCPALQTFADGKRAEITVCIQKDRGDRWFKNHSYPIHDDSGNVILVILLVEEITEQLTMERELRQAQKLESIGQLAAGIAHELNTPAQYVSSNIGFLQEAFTDIAQLVQNYDNLLESLPKEQGTSQLITAGKAYRDEVDWPYLRQEIPEAIEQSITGLNQMSSIVLAMKNFTHPGGGAGKEMTDVNEIIENTLTISRNEWKLLMKPDLHLSPNLPMVPCAQNELAQVFLNIIINAAHSMEEKVTPRSEDPEGRIKIHSCFNDNSVILSFADNGCGITESNINKIFDPFFTTKTVGKGTGQGLAIAYDLIVNKHQGRLEVESSEGIGTTFTIHLPVDICQ